MLVVAIAIIASTQVAMWISAGPPALPGSVEDRLEKAAELAHRGSPGADEAYRATTVTFPEDVRGWLAYGDHLASKGDDAGAEAAYQGACGASENRAKTAPAWRRLGMIAWRHARWREAETALNQAVAGEDHEAERAYALFRATVRHSDDDEWARRILERSPDDAAMLLLVATWMALAGHADEAASLCARACSALDCAPAALAGASDPWVRYLAARLHAANGDAPAAAACLAGALAHPRRPALERAHLLGDPAFANPPAVLGAVIGEWPERLPEAILPAPERAGVPPAAPVAETPAPTIGSPPATPRSGTDAGGAGGELPAVP